MYYSFINVIMLQSNYNIKQEDQRPVYGSMVNTQQIKIIKNTYLVQSYFIFVFDFVLGGHSQGAQGLFCTWKLLQEYGWESYEMRGSNSDWPTCKASTLPLYYHFSPNVLSLNYLFI